MRPLNTDAFLYVNLPHNKWMTSAQQLMDIRTTADMQAHNSCCAVHDSIFRNDRYYIFQHLMPVLSAPLPISINAQIHYREQTETHIYRTEKA